MPLQKPAPFPGTQLKPELRVNRRDFIQPWAGKAAAVPEHPSASERGGRDRVGSPHIAKVTVFSSKNVLLQKQPLGPSSFLPLHTKHPADVTAQLFVQQMLHSGGPEETGLTPPEQESRHRVRHSEPTHCSGHPSKQENSSRSPRLPSHTGLQTPHLLFWSPGCFTRASSGLRSRKAEYFPNCKHQSVPSAFSKPPRWYKTGSNPMH